MSNIDEITARSAADLKDAAHATWSAEELARAARWALHELSWALPRRAAATLAAQQGVREYALSTAGIADALYVVEVWHPYGAGAAATRPRPVPWRLLGDGVLLLDVDEVYAGEGIRIFFARPHTIEGLDGAAATTLTGEQEELVALAASGYAALQRAQEAIGQTGLPEAAPGLWRDWGERRICEFRTRLNQLARREMQWRETWTEGWSEA